MGNGDFMDPQEAPKSCEMATRLQVCSSVRPFICPSPNVATVAAISKTPSAARPSVRPSAHLPRFVSSFVAAHRQTNAVRGVTGTPPAPPPRRRLRSSA